MALARLDIDAFPDTTPVQVQINTVAPALGPEEVERQITFPIEQGLSGLPGLEQLRSISKFGLSQVVVVFRRRHRHLLRPPGDQRTAGDRRAARRHRAAEDGAGRHRAGRSLSLHRDRRRGPTRPSCAPSTIGSSGRSCGPCRGTAEINSWGGYEKQYQIRIDPDRLIKHDLTFDEVVEAVEKNNLNVGGGNISQDRRHAARPRPGPHDQRRADPADRRHGQGRRADPRRATWPTWRSATKSAAGPSRPTARAKWCWAWASC